MHKKQIFFSFLSVCFIVCALFFASSVSADQTPFISIENGASEVTRRSVDLRLRGPEDAFEMRLSENRDFSGSKWESYKREKEWTLSYNAGVKYIYIQFRNNAGEVSNRYQDTIRLRGSRNMNVSMRINDNARETSKRAVEVTFTYNDGVEFITLSNDSRFRDAETFDATGKISWIIPSGEGTKTIYARVSNIYGSVETLERSIRYNQPADYIPEHSVVKTSDGTLYYVGVRDVLHRIPSLATYHSYFPSIKDIEFVTNKRTIGMAKGDPLCLRQGTWLLRFTGRSTVYAVEPACRLRRIRSDVEGFVLYGANWEDRVLTLPATQRNWYTTRGIVALEEGEVDADNDGLPAQEELLLGTLDRLADTDRDGLTDYEEVRYWLTDPKKKDTDQDGTSDSQEIINGESPTGFSSLERVTNGYYPYPKGSVLKISRRYYYVTGDRTAIDIGRSFDTNRFQQSFVIVPQFETNLSISGRVSGSDESIRSPLEKVEDRFRLY